MKVTGTEEERAARRALGARAVGFFDPAEVPGLVEAIKDEGFHWDVSFLGLGEEICGFKVKPLCVRQLVTLSAIKSPFLLNAPEHFYYGYPAIGKQIENFMWIVSKGFNPDAWLRRKLFFFCYRNLFAKQPITVAVPAILKFINEGMSDCRNSNSSGDAYCSIAATVIDLMAMEYGWTMAEILDCPVKIIFQLVRCIRRRKGDKLFKKSDQLISEYLDRENAKLRGMN